jgi:hypothetical protein
MKHEMNVLGIDIAKRVFHAVGMDDRGNIVYRKRLSRHDLIPFIAKLSPVLIGIEACGGAHYWARRFRAYGHEVKLVVYPYVTDNSGVGKCGRIVLFHDRERGDRYSAERVVLPTSIRCARLDLLHDPRLVARSVQSHTSPASQAR